MIPTQQQTFNAIVKSIVKWLNIYNGTHVDHARMDCALCDLFYRVTVDIKATTMVRGIMESMPSYESMCSGCPIELATGECACQGTPYIKFSSYCIPRVGFRRVFNRKSRRLAKAELDFLISLVPDGFYLDPSLIDYIKHLENKYENK